MFPVTVMHKSKIWVTNFLNMGLGGNIQINISNSHYQLVARRIFNSWWLLNGYWINHIYLVRALSICWHWNIEDSFWPLPARNRTMFFTLVITNRGRSQTALTSFWFFFDYLPLSVDILFLINIDEKLTFLEYLPPFSCKCSLWTTP